MSVRFASFNVENLFARPKAMNLTTWADGQPILDAFAELEALFNHAVYTSEDRARMVELLLQLDVYRRVDGVVRRNRSREPRWVWLRANRGTFDVERADTGIEIVADGRSDWVGWVELATEPVDELATRMTARVIADVAADVLAVVEAEDRPSLDRFNSELLAGRYAHCMVIDGNDSRGIDVGIMTTGAVELVSLRSNVDTADPVSGDHLFSRDCPEYRCRMGSGADVYVLVNHFKSQSGGGGPRRARQAAEVVRIVDGLFAAGHYNVIVMGDLNEGPTTPGEPAPSLAALLGPDSPVVDVNTLPVFDPGPRPGTFQSCGLRNRLDYIAVSRDLLPHVIAGGIERRGLWGTPTNVNPPRLWPVYPEITGSEHAASDHAAIYIDLDI
jgi:endonuclease/exonuclease/phosphatase family metal-dependent hydrolase